ncbi:MAG: BamA/TamA family outer membrane protein [Muribaculaceae bacterium]
MRKFDNNILLQVLVSIAIVASAISCSTTSRLEDDEVLYTGVKKLNIMPASDSIMLEEGVAEAVASAINVAPNNSLYSPYIRHPFPVGLWVYNHWNDSAKGLKGWLYKKLVDEPVLVSTVRPEHRVEMINTVLHDNGYFDSNASYQLIYSKRNKKKARIQYDVTVNEPYVISSVGYLNNDVEICQKIDSLARVDKYLRPGSRYSLDSLNAVRVNITNTLRNRGYYYFRPEYIEYLADSTLRKGKIALRLSLAPGVPVAALNRYTTGNVTTVVQRYQGGGTPDTTELPRKGTLVKMTPMRLRNSAIAGKISFRKGRVLSVRDMDRTQSNLSNMGIFNAINIEVTPMDSLQPGQNQLDVNVNCTMDRQIEAKIEAQATSKSNSYIGPGLSLGLAHKNLFGGAEVINTELHGSYEWATGGKAVEGYDYNSYELGLSSTLSIPQLLAPKFIDRSRRYQNWTKFSLSADLLNRPSFFKMVQFGTGFTWQWHAGRHSLNELTPFKLTYTKLLNTTDAFNESMNNNPAVYESFRNQFTAQLQYNYTYDRAFGRDNLTFNLQLIEAGNLLAGLWALGKSKGEKCLFGTPFSQFVKGQASVVYKHGLFNGHSLVSRVLVGAAHAYGNSSVVPYADQFYIGGANSLRAFAVRSIGPGSYLPSADNPNAYYDQTGTFKFEANLEYRFPLFSFLKGAAFIDAGNVWLLQEDENRVGGKLKMKNFMRELALGTGVGLRFDMEMLVIRADLGYALHAPYETGESGYFNMPSFKKSIAFHLAIGYPF